MAKRQFEANGKGTSLEEKGLKLLLVDEDADDLGYYSAMLRYLGYEVRSLSSYAKAAESLERERFDLVIIDQGTSDFEGRSALTRAVEIDHRVPILMLAREVNADCCLEALDSGAYEYVQKPLTATEVRELVSDYVRSSSEKVSSGHDYVLPQGIAERSIPQDGRAS